MIGARENNLKDITVDIPLGLFTAVTGVSGGGKSTFLIETLYRAVARKLNNARELPGEHDAIEGIEQLDKVIDIDQSPIGRTPRSNPATYTGAFTPIREWFAELPEAKTRGYKPGRFSFNVKGGRCEACQGDGVIKIEMHFLPDIYVTCDVCKGARYNRETLEVKFKGKSIADVLDMTVEEAAELFKAVPAVRDKLETLKRVGLGYIHVGQQATTLSGGEAQRIKLSKELSKRATGRTLYILDEPTTGLHFHDVAKLLEVLHELVDQGNTCRRDRAQSGRDQDRGLDHRPRPGRRRRRRPCRRRRHAGGDRGTARELYGAVFAAGAEAAWRRRETRGAGRGVSSKPDIMPSVVEPAPISLGERPLRAHGRYPDTTRAVPFHLPARFVFVNCDALGLARAGTCLTHCPASRRGRLPIKPRAIRGLVIGDSDADPFPPGRRKFTPFADKRLRIGHASWCIGVRAGP